MVIVHDLRKLEKMARQKGYQLSPELWSTLPDDLRDIILVKVFNGAPIRFARLRTFRCLGNRIWKDLFLPCTRYLVHFQKGQLAAFNSSINSWQEISLQFCERQLPGLVLRDLKLESSSGGLLYFFSKVDGEYIVCNPLTKCCKKFTRQQPPGHYLDADAEIQQFHTRVVANTHWPAAYISDPLSDPPFSQKVFVYYTDVARGLSFVVMHNSRRLQLITSEDVGARKCWAVKLDEAQPGGCYVFIDRPVMYSCGMLALGFDRGAHIPGGFQLLVYDLKRQVCVWVPGLHSPSTVATSGRQEYKRLVGNIGNKLDFFKMHVRRAGDSLTLLPSSRSLSQFLVRWMLGELRQKILKTRTGVQYQVSYTEQEGVAYAVGLTQLTTGCKTLLSVASVRMYDRADNSELLFERKEDWGFKNGRFSMDTCLYVFKPTDAPVSWLA